MRVCRICSGWFAIGRLLRQRCLAPAATVALLALGAISSLCCSPAWGAIGHGFVSSFSAVGGEARLQEPVAIAVDAAQGRVFVGDQAAGVVDVFSLSGAFLTQFGDGSLEAQGLAVSEASGDVYVADSFEDAVLVFRPQGSDEYALSSEWAGEALPAKGFGEVTGVAVDNSSGPSAGDVYVVDGEDPSSGEGAVYVFRPKGPGPEEGAEGEIVRTLSAKLQEPNGVIVSKGSGEVFVADSANGEVVEFSASGAQEGKPLTGKGSPQGPFSGPDEEEGNVSALALDEASGDLLVAEGERRVVSEFNPAGEWVGWITGTPAGPFGQPRGVAVAPSGDVYVSDAERQLVDVFGPGVLVPDAATGKASKVARTSALLNGTIDGDGESAKYHFEWGTSEALGQSTPVQAAGTGEEKVAATVSGLHPSTTYFFRTVAEGANGANAGVVREFTTPTAVEGVSTGVVSDLKPESATLTGSLKPGGIDAHYYFEWGTGVSYGNTTPLPPGTDAGSGSEAVAASADLSGLAPNTLYHYRIVAVNELGVTHGEDRHFTTPGPPRITYEPPTGIGHDEATIHASVDPDQYATSYHFEYGETTAYGTETPLGGASIPAGETPVKVSAILTNLKIGTTYHYRIVASNEGGAPVTGADETLTTIPPAPVDETYVTAVGAGEATLHTAINPLGHDTHFYFQYGTENCAQQPAGCTDVPAAPGSDVGAGETNVPETQTITGLKADTTYFYRVLDSNSLGATEGPQHTFITRAEESGGPVGLADGRAWEMVTPPIKDSPVEALTKEGGMILASENGDKLAYVTEGPVGEEAQGNRSPEQQQILAARGEHEWISQDIATPSTRAKGTTAGETPEYQDFTPNLATAVVEPPGPEPAPPLAPGVTQDTIYLRNNETGTYLPLVTNENTAPGTHFGKQVHFVDATADLSHVVIRSGVGLLGEGSSEGLYEWSAGNLAQVSILPTGAPATGLAQLGYSNTEANAISAGGTRILWTVSDPLSEAHQGPLYLRDTERGETLRLDAAQGVSEPSESPEARFQTASSDGSRVFFTDRLKLTPNSTAESTAKEPDLYECEIVVENGKLACKLSDLTAAAHPGEHANIKGSVLGENSEGTTLYLIAQDVLAENENGNHETATAGQNNLFELHYEGSKWNDTFIATLSGEDRPEWEVNRNADTAYLTARVSPDGRYLAFMSEAAITGYDNTDQNSGQLDEEVFLYDSETARLRCVSCNPTGGRPIGVLDTLNSGEGLGLVVEPAARVELGSRRRTRTLARGQHPGLDGAEHRKRDHAVALPVERRTPVLQQSRRTGAGGHQPQGGRLRVRAQRARQLRKLDRRLRFAGLLGHLQPRIGVPRSYARWQRSVLHHRRAAAPPGRRHGI